MPKLYSVKRHERELSAVRDEYDGRLKELQAAMTELKEENRRLAAELSVSRSQKQAVSEAMIAASEKREEMRRDFDSFVAAQKALVMQAAEKAQALLEDIMKEYPDREKTARFKAFRARLDELLGGTAEGKEPREIIFSEEASEETEGSVSSTLPPDDKRITGPVSEEKAWELEEVLNVLGLV